MRKRELKRILRTRFLVHDAYMYLAAFAAECIFDKENLHFTDEASLRQKYWENLVDQLGSAGRWGQLQRDQEKHCRKLLSRLKADFPRFGKERILVFSHAVAGIPDNLTMRLAGLSSENAVRVMRAHIKDDILGHDSPWREEYLAMLSKEGLRSSGRNAIFA